MKKILTVLAVVVLLTNACKKDGGESEAEISIVGTWTLSEGGTDANNNNVVDAGETSSAAALASTIQFKSDNTYTATITLGSTPIVASGTYTVAGGTISTVSEGNTKTGTVHTLTKNKLILKRTVSGSAQWEIYTR